MPVSTIANAKVCLSERHSNPCDNINLTYKLYGEEIFEQNVGKTEIFSIFISIDNNGSANDITLTDIARDKAKALELFGIFADGDVDPCSAPYIIEELLCRSEYL
ncbi:MAG: DUF6514 family protein [Oscillospiraceae bacterium]|nr:DUF6514 family protein [Oscillospiraceae bacterium]